MGRGEGVHRDLISEGGRKQTPMPDLLGSPTGEAFPWSCSGKWRKGEELWVLCPSLGEEDDGGSPRREKEWDLFQNVPKEPLVEVAGKRPLPPPCELGMACLST